MPAITAMPTSSKATRLPVTGRFSRLPDIGTVDQHRADAKREREEGLAHGVNEQSGIGDLGEVRHQVGAQTVDCPRQRQHVNDQQQQNEDQHRHQP